MTSDTPVNRESKLTIGAAVGLMLLQVGASVVFSRGFALTAVSDTISALLILIAVLAFGRSAISSRGRVRSVWLLQSAGWSFWLADLSAWCYYDLVLRKPMPVMFPGDVLLFLAGIPMLAGFLLRPHLLPSEQSSQLGIIDLLLLFMWWIYFYSYLVICWLYISKNVDFYNRNYDRLYLIEVLVQALTLCVLISQSSGAWKRTYAFFLCAMVFNAACVGLEDNAIEKGTYYNGSWYDIFLAASFAPFIFLALTSRNLQPVAETAQDKKYGSWVAGLAAIATLSLPIIMVATMFAGSEPSKVQTYRISVTAGALFGMGLLVFLKQWRLHAQLKRTNEILRDAALTDPLTQVRNRRFFSMTVEDEVAQTLRAFSRQDRASRDLIFYLIDLDNFKEVNDRFGHDAGDRLLIETTRRIRTVIRSSDLLIRWGGEEFLVVCQRSDRRQAHVLASRLLDAIRVRPFLLNDGCEILRTCSIGWAAFPAVEEDTSALDHEEVLKLADRALLAAKQAGKDRAFGLQPSTPNPFERLSVVGSLDTQ